MHIILRSFSSVLALSFFLILSFPACVIALEEWDWARNSIVDFLDPWAITGSNTMRWEYYDVSGDEAASPYPFTGGQFYN